MKLVVIAIVLFVMESAFDLNKDEGVFVFERVNIEKVLGIFVSEKGLLSLFELELKFSTINFLAACGGFFSKKLSRLYVFKSLFLDLFRKYIFGLFFNKNEYVTHLRINLMYLGFV